MLAWPQPTRHNPAAKVPFGVRPPLRASLRLLIGTLLATPAMAAQPLPQSAGPVGPGGASPDAPQPAPAPALSAGTAPTKGDPKPIGDIMKPGEVIDFAADAMNYDNAANIVTATGNVVVERNGSRMRADTVTYNRKTGQLDAKGDVIVVDRDGNRLLGDQAKVSEDLKNAAIQNLLLVLEDGGRAAAVRATRVDGVDTLYRAVYSPCSVVDGCHEVKPLWRIKAVRVIHDPYRGRFSYKGASFDIGGVPVLYLPAFSHPDGGGKNAPGLLTPDARYDRLLGLTLITPYYVPLAPNRDLTVTPYIFSDTTPMLGMEYRQLLGSGPFKVGGLVTYSRQFQQDVFGNDPVPRGQELRGYFYANGQLQLSEAWRVTAAIRLTSDTSFLRRYDITQDDVLRNLARVERFGNESYFSAEGWAFQGLRPTDQGGQTPIVLPLIDWRWRPSDAILGGHIDLLANTQVVTRPDAEDTQRGLAQARYIALLTTAMGQRITFTGQVRAQAYHVSDAQGLAQQQYAGTNGWHGRIIPAVSADVQWPFAGPALGGVQTITPRVQLVSSPFVANSVIPNEDARAIDLTENNLFDINRFPGYDRWEGGQRVSYGVMYTLDRPSWRVSGELGQSYRLTNEPGLFPPGTGLTNQFSDIVGRASIQVGRFIEVTDRFRLNRDTLAIRRQEADLTLGTNRNFVQLSYTRLHRNIGIEDLPDTHEARVAARLQFARYWAAFGATVLDLGGTQSSIVSATNYTGFQPVRHRVGLSYDDECFSFSFSWRRDYLNVLDRPAGDSFLFRVAFKNLGR